MRARFQAGASQGTACCVAPTQSRPKGNGRARDAVKRKIRGACAPPVGWKSGYFFFFLAAFLVAFFLVAMVSILPSICHGILRLKLSSQFVSCIESLKKIVKQKTHSNLSWAAMRERAHAFPSQEKRWRSLNAIASSMLYMR
jgi:hypothetical protein